MGQREKLLAGILVAGVLLLVGAGVFAFVQGHRLLATRRLAEEEHQTQDLLDTFSTRLRDLRREAFNFVLLTDAASLEDFNCAAEHLQALTKSLEAEPEILGGKDNLDRLFADTHAYVEDYRQIVARAQTEGSAAALRQAGEVIRQGRMDRLLETVSQLQEASTARFAEQSTRISEAARDATRAIGLFIVVALALILFSAGRMLRYYLANQALLAEATALNLKLEASRKEIESIVSFVSHDLRVPLVNIRGFSEVLSEDSRRLAGIVEAATMPAGAQAEVSAIVRESLPESLDFIRGAADAMERLITTMVKVARAGQMPVQPRRVDARAMIEGIIKDFEFRIKETAATVEIEPLPNCMADPGQVRQVFSNLVDNAIKYRDPARPLQVRITGTVEAGRSVYCVEDNGVGIDEKDLPSILEMYYQVKDMDAGGEGLGLALARKMVERNGGALEVRSELHRGSKFFIRLRTAD